MPRSMWTIYDRPPGLHFFTAIRFDFSEDGTDAWPTDDMLVGIDLDEIRDDAARPRQADAGAGDQPEDHRAVATM